MASRKSSAAAPSAKLSAAKHSPALAALLALSEDSRKVAIDNIMGDPAVWNSSPADVQDYVKSVRPEAYKTPPVLMEVASPATVAAVKAKRNGKAAPTVAAGNPGEFQIVKIADIIDPGHDRDPGKGDSGEGDDLSDLAASIKARGVETPIRLRLDPEDDGKYRVIFGRRRYAASIMAGLEFIPAMVVKGESTDDDVSAFIENVQRKSLSQYEMVVQTGKLCQTMVVAQVAQMTGLGESFVRKLNSVSLKCIPRALEALKAKKVTLLDCIKLYPKTPAEQEAALALLLGETAPGGAGGASSGDAASDSGDDSPTVSDTVKNAVRIWKEKTLARPGVARYFGSAIEGMAGKLKGKGALDLLEQLDVMFDRAEDILKATGLDKDDESVDPAAAMVAEATEQDGGPAGE